MNLGLGGKLSGGKTVTGIRYCYDKFLQGKKVISNVFIDFSPYKDDTEKARVVYMSNSALIDYIKMYYDNQTMLRKLFFNSVLFIDEIVNILSARKSSTTLNELFTNFLMMAGKLDCDVIFTYQVMESQVDLRLREISNVKGNCYRISAKTGEPLIDKERIIGEKILICVVLEFDFDILGIKTGQLVFDPEPYFKFYDTREITLLDRSKYMAGGSKDLRK